MFEKKIDAKIEELKNFIKRDFEMTSNKQKFFAIYDEVLKNVSLSKRSSHGLSLADEA